MMHVLDDSDITINRNSFVFYDSFYKAMKHLNKDEKVEYIEAICQYSLYDITIEMNPKIEGMFELVKAQIDANIKTIESGAESGHFIGGDFSKRPVFLASSNKFISRPKTISALVDVPSKIILVSKVAALSAAINSISWLNFSSNFFSIIGPGPHFEVNESYV